MKTHQGLVYPSDEQMDKHVDKAHRDSNLREFSRYLIEHNVAPDASEKDTPKQLKAHLHRHSLQHPTPQFGGGRQVVAAVAASETENPAGGGSSAIETNPKKMRTTEEFGNQPSEFHSKASADQARIAEMEEGGMREAGSQVEGNVAGVERSDAGRYEASESGNRIDRTVGPAYLRGIVGDLGHAYPSRPLADYYFQIDWPANHLLVTRLKMLDNQARYYRDDIMRRRETLGDIELWTEAEHQEALAKVPQGGDLKEHGKVTLLERLKNSPLATQLRSHAAPSESESQQESDPTMSESYADPVGTGPEDDENEARASAVAKDKQEPKIAGRLILHQKF
ncbi:unnamed protein product [Didymodactylos carnosus]|uniref:Uncharacterized protein n=1 Tax=Didymodactylos carnosus TaxID=1234261 RepID=A0A8S2M0N1_9BILA|nr:unnamed protein product [Didymodactylos carnosus]CAF3918020.1 unnamed protein product [Didymodactylos carnosus]